MKFTLSIVLPVINFFTFGWLFPYLWLWFVSPALGVPAIGFFTALGLRIVINVLVPNYARHAYKEHLISTKPKLKEYSDYIMSAADTFVILITTFTGWLYVLLQAYFG